VMVFSGFTLAEIHAAADPDALDLLAHTDLLVDGPYLRDRPEHRRRKRPRADPAVLWRGLS